MPPWLLARQPLGEAPAGKRVRRWFLLHFLDPRGQASWLVAYFVICAKKKVSCPLPRSLGGGEACPGAQSLPGLDSALARGALSTLPPPLSPPPLPPSPSPLPPLLPRGSCWCRPLWVFFRPLDAGPRPSRTWTFRRSLACSFTWWSFIKQDCQVAPLRH